MRPPAAGVRVDGAPAAAGLVRAPVVAPAEAAAQVAAAVSHAVGTAPLLGLHVEDEVQAEGRVAAKIDPAAAGLPSA